MEQEERLVKRELLSAIPVLGCAIAVPVLAYFSILMPGMDKPEIWFQRSGAVTVLLVLIAEYGLGAIGGHVNPTGLIVSQQAELSEKYKTPYKVAKYIGAVLAVVGTIIWGYGDLAWLKLNA